MFLTKNENVITIRMMDLLILYYIEQLRGVGGVSEGYTGVRRGVGGVRRGVGGVQEGYPRGVGRGVSEG